MSCIPDDLRKAFEATDYAAGDIVIRVGRRSPELDALLGGEREWAYITAWNPGSKRLSALENRHRSALLRAALARQAKRVIPGIGKGPDGRGEASYLALGLSEDEAISLGRRFGQLAIVAGVRGAPPRLVECCCPAHVAAGRGFMPPGKDLRAMATLKQVRYGPLDRYNAPPGAGFCMSAFAVVRQGRKVLLGRPAPHARWIPEWVEAWGKYEAKEREQAMATPRLPGAYLAEFEHPEDTLKRVVRDQLGIRRFEPKGLTVLSYQADSEWYPGQKHWDVAFVYEVKASAPARKPAWWSELGFQDTAKLRARDFGWNHDLMKDLGLAR